MNGRDLSTFQALLLVEVPEKENVSGMELRERIKEYGYRKTGPTFYAMMSRLEDLGLVASDFVEEKVRGRSVRSKVFTRTKNGMKAIDEWEQLTGSNLSKKRRSAPRDAAKSPPAIDDLITVRGRRSVDV